MWLSNFGVHYNPPMNIVQLIVFKVIMFRKNIDLLPTDDSSDISPGNNNLTEGIKIVRVGIPLSNQIGCV